MQVHAIPLAILPPQVQPTFNGWDVLLVPSDSNPSKTYTVDVTFGRCSCPGWTKHKPNAYGIRPCCKHLRRLGFVQVPDPVELADPAPLKTATCHKVKA